MARKSTNVQRQHPVIPGPTPLHRLLALPRYATSGSAAMKPGLGRIQALLAAMGSPERTFDTVLVAGTNGKGTTAAMMASVLGATGMRVGLHTSPHLARVTERMRVGGREATEDWLARATSRHWAAIETTGASFFEATLALSALYFAEQEVDVAAIEVGLGGRLDATNAFPAALSVITHIGLDHTDILGHTLAAIATEKAGIAKRGQPLVVGALAPGALAAVRLVAARERAPLVLAASALPDSYGLVPDSHGLPAAYFLDTCALPFPGRHMRGNAVVALAACQELLGQLPAPALVRRALEETISRTGLRGRLETLRASPRIIVDVGHNADAVEAALEAVRALGGPNHHSPTEPSSAPASRPVSTLVLGMLRDKDADAVGRVVARFQRADGGWPRVWAVGTLSPDETGSATHARGQSAAWLAARLDAAGCPVDAQFDSASAALHALLTEDDHAPGALFMGSHHIAAEVIQNLER